MNPNKTISVLGATTVALTAAFWLSAQETSSMSPQGDEKFSEARKGESNASLAASLTDYGRETEDLFALLAAASIFNDLDGLVEKRNSKADLQQHDTDAYFSVSRILDDAQALADNSEDGFRDSVLNIIKKLRSEVSASKKKTMDMLDTGAAAEYFVHTHYVWDCDMWGNCRYVWYTHSHP